MATVRSPYAVICRIHGQQFLTPKEYIRQLERPDELWECPVCKGTAQFDDANFEHYVERGRF